MQRKRFLTILIGIVVIVIIGVIVFLVVSFAKNNQTGEEGSGFSLFPRGGNSGVVETQDDPITQGPTSEAPLDDTQETPRLRRLADFPVAALASHYRPEKIVVERIIEVSSEEGAEDATIENEDENTETETEEAPAETQTITEVLDVNQLYARYVRHEDGAVFTSKIGTNLEQSQTTLASIPYVGDAAIGNYGNSIVYRFFNNNTQSIETLLGTIIEKNIPEAVCAAALPDEINADSEGSQITLLQEFLIYTLEEEATSDGQWGAETRQMLRDFQSLYNLDATGTVTDETVNEINNQCLDIVQEKARAQQPTDLGGVFLTNNIVAMSVSPSTETLVYFTKKENDTIAITFDFATKSLEQIFSSPFSEWTPRWTSNENITVYTKPSGVFGGFVYDLDITDGTLNKLVSGMTGLTGIINPSQDKLLTSQASSTIANNSVVTIADGSTLTAPFKTLSEKCVWSQDSVIIYCAVPDFIERGLYPDDWYKGKVSFTDSIWSLNTQTGETRQIADLTREGGEPFDVIKPSLESNELYMFFINKKTGEPWILEL